MYYSDWVIYCKLKDRGSIYDKNRALSFLEISHTSSGAHPFYYVLLPRQDCGR